MSFDIVELIVAKRDGAALDDDAIAWILRNYPGGAVADEQMSALLMAILFRGLDPRELRTWTDAMIASGARLDLRGLSRPTVDKHSTGGVGDKISLILAPLVAACGAAVPQLSGRGLGYTGGTLDKLEAIPGWRSTLDDGEIRRQLEDVGAVVCAAGGNLAPVDRALYALRDVTGTVESIPLISSSIMSKKIAEGTQALVLDVKVGRGAFMEAPERARELAETMVALGESHGVRTRAQLSAMDRPLGRAVGNALEVAESIDVLRGGGPPDVRQLTLALARLMLEAVGIDVDPATRLDDGSAYETFVALVRAQGGDPDAALPGAAHRTLVRATRPGLVAAIDARAIGVAAWRAGAGRARKEDPVSPGAGVQILVERGQPVAVGDPLLEVRADDSAHLERAVGAAASAVAIDDVVAPELALLLDRVEGAAH